MVANGWKLPEIADKHYKLLDMTGIDVDGIESWKWLYVTWNDNDNNDDYYNESNGMAQSQFWLRLDIMKLIKTPCS